MGLMLDVLMFFLCGLAGIATVVIMVLLCLEFFSIIMGLCNKYGCIIDLDPDGILIPICYICEGGMY